MTANAVGETALDTLCEVRGVSHDFVLPNGRPNRVLEDISLAIHPEEVVALLGPSGCGKSTILRILAGLVQPTRGEVLYHGRPLMGLNPGVSIVFQSFALYPWMTVLANVEVVLKAAGILATETRASAEASVRRVGLAGFEEAYPRELSGGMKQRVGMARALAVNPEMLFMDEPFSQVDALTAESLRAEVIDIWTPRDRNPSSIVMVSHDIKEVVYMADRIVMLGTNPAHILTIVKNELPRPRDYRSPDALALVDHLHEIITGHELPDAPEASPARTEAEPGGVPGEPLPDASASEIVGMLEYLAARGGREDVFRIAADTGCEFGRLIAVVKAAEMLNFVDTPKHWVVLDTDGQRFVKADAEGRKAIWREQLLKLRLFREIHDLLQHQPGGEIDADLALERIIFTMPQEDHEKVFETFVRWARFGNLFAYEDGRRRLSLQ